jgi:hypothetical protein
MMIQTAKEERTMTRYLLGAATEEECVEVEGRFLRDAEYLKQLRAIECEIIDDYVGGEMSEAERRSFERRSMASPQGREQVARARKLRARLGHIAAESREPAPSPALTRESLWKKLRASPFKPAHAFQYAMATAAALLMLGGPWLLREGNLSRSRIAELTAERDLARRNEKDLQERLATQIENEKSMQERMRRLQAQSSPPAARDGDFVELALSSGIERNSGDPRRLSIPMNVRMVKLQLELDPSVNHHSYRVELNTSGGAQVWFQGGLIGRQTDWGRFVTLTIPARALQGGEYELILRGSTREKKSEVAGYYYFIASPSGLRKQ